MAAEQKYGRTCREMMFREVKQALADNPNFIITNYLGLSVGDLDSLRKKMKKSSSQYLVVKNSICKRTLESLKLPDLVKDVSGGVGLGLLGGDPVASTKVIVDFARENSVLKIRAGCIDGSCLDGGAIKRLASLPSREQLLSMALQAMKGPITGFVGALGGILRKFVYVVNAIKDKKEGGK